MSGLELALLGVVAALAEEPRSQVVTLANTGSFPALLEAELAKAKAAKLLPFLEFTADWCAPCVAFDKHLGDPLMRDALDGTYLIRADYDVWAKAADDLGVVGIPTWIALGPDGRPTGRTLTSSVWGEDVPANMAPPLKAFFSAGRPPRQEQ